MKIRRAAAQASIAALLPFAGVALAQAQDASGADNDLRREIEDQKQRLAILERKLELSEEAAKSAASSAPKITANATQFRIATASNTRSAFNGSRA